MSNDTFENMSCEELDRLNQRVISEKAKRIEERVQREREELIRIGQERGYLVDMIFSGSKSMKRPKYRNPDDHHQTWSGLGRRPDWFNNALNKDIRPEEMLIKD